MDTYNLVENVLEQFNIDDKKLYSICQFFSSFSDFTRLRIITALSISPLCVSEISNCLKINQTTVSHQLKILKDNNIVDFVRNGKSVMYRLISSDIEELLDIAVNLIYN